jgi:twitching motility two-component system response regulator PilG
VVVDSRSATSSGSSNPHLLRDAILFAQAGKVEIARKLLSQAADTDPGNELVWVWSASLARTRNEALDHMRRVLQINPDNRTVLSWLQRLRPGSAPVPQGWTCPLCETTYKAKVTRCSHCRANLDLSDLEEVGKDRNLKKDVLREAIKRFEAILERGPDFEAHRQLAVIHLNLMMSSEAVKHLREASHLQPDDKQIGGSLATLLKRKRVLVVDDSLTIRTMISSVLEGNRYRAHTAVDGFAALAQMGEELPHLVLLDVRMPGMDGYQVCKAIRRHGPTNRLPVIMISGSLMDRVRGKMAGCTGYLPKPFSKEHLLKVITKHLPEGTLSG